MSPTYREGSPLSVNSLLQTVQVLIAPVGALPSTVQRFFTIILPPPFRLNGRQMKSGGAIGLIIGIRTQVRGCSGSPAHWSVTEAGARIRPVERSASSFVMLIPLKNTLVSWPVVINWYIAFFWLNLCPSFQYKLPHGASLETSETYYLLLYWFYRIQVTQISKLGLRAPYDFPPKLASATVASSSLPPPVVLQTVTCVPCTANSEDLYRNFSGYWPPRFNPTYCAQELRPTAH